MLQKNSVTEQSIQKIELGFDRKTRFAGYIDQEKNIAIKELLQSNLFCLKGQEDKGPLSCKLSLIEHNLIFEIKDILGRKTHLTLPIKPFRRLIKDYFLICESFMSVSKEGNLHKIEAIDHARQAIHNEGAEMLKRALKDKAITDMNTARRLFTLICILHV